MILQEILHGTEWIGSKDEAEIEITGITDDSRECREGFLFVAVKGFRTDGHRFIEKAIELGASAIVGEEDMSGLPVPYIRMKNSRQALALFAKNFYGNPSRDKVMIGITGTNGKTTTCYMIRHLLEENGISCSQFGTVEHIINGVSIESHNTTPGTLELNRLLAKSRDRAVVMEISSHGLAQSRLEGLEFDFCLFTNLHQDHLDFHGTMEQYFKAKSLLFEKLKPEGLAIINADDAWGLKLHQSLMQEEQNTFLIGMNDTCDLAIIDYQAAPNPAILLYEEEGFAEISISLPGLHNLYNAAFAYAVTRTFPIEKEDILSSFHTFSGVPGRFEQLPDPHGKTVVIDYAHTADALAHILQTARESGAKRIFHIFGFRGTRDQGKRTEMVKISSALSDFPILTMDDLNEEKAEDMLASLYSLRKEYSSETGVVIPDRTVAIHTALEAALSGDWIIITGKGPEEYQQLYALPTLSDRETVLYLQEMEKEMH